ncbi:hypothetical protein [Cohnella caldifontis]|uniref:hypothetical protein n=1 Tax=Cohnella caldifontis TaxID=3027471 RepID=UPI0023EB0E29|nr:hypothetical protein [Cohnella sp. YIM B05605]
MALVKNPETIGRPRVAARIEQAMQLAALKGDDRKACSLLLFYLAYMADDHPLMGGSRLSERLYAYAEAIGLTDVNDESACADLLQHSIAADSKAAKARNRLAAELAKSIAFCKGWLRDNGVAELDLYPRLLKLYPIYLLVLLIGIARWGLLGAESEAWRLHSDHRWLLQSTRFQLELSTKGIPLLQGEMQA